MQIACNYIDPLPLMRHLIQGSFCRRLLPVSTPKCNCRSAALAPQNPITYFRWHVVPPLGSFCCVSVFFRIVWGGGGRDSNTLDRSKGSADYKQVASNMNLFLSGTVAEVDMRRLINA